MDTYIIKKAYHWTESDEIEIKSDGLLYTELGQTHSGCQSTNLNNNDEIHKKCNQITILIREIEQLNVYDGKNANTKNGKLVIQRVSNNYCMYCEKEIKPSEAIIICKDCCK